MPNSKVAQDAQDALTSDIRNIGLGGQKDREDAITDAEKFLEWLEEQDFSADSLISLVNHAIRDEERHVRGNEERSNYDSYKVIRDSQANLAFVQRWVNDKVSILANEISNGGDAFVSEASAMAAEEQKKLGDTSKDVMEMGKATRADTDAARDESMLLESIVQG